MLQPETEGRKATWLCHGDAGTATYKRPRAQLCLARQSAAPVSLISQPHLPETPDGPLEKQRQVWNLSTDSIISAALRASVAASRLPLIGLSEQDVEI